MTREEIIASETAVPKFCRGYLSVAARRLKQQAWDRGLVDLAVMVDVANRCRTEDELAVLFVLYSQTEAIATLEGGSTEPYAPRRCDYNFNYTILAGPFDGKVHSYQCPRCGVTGEYQAPLEE